MKQHTDLPHSSPQSHELRFITEEGRLITMPAEKWRVDNVEAAVEKIARTIREYNLGSAHIRPEIYLPRNEYLGLFWRLHSNSEGVAYLRPATTYLGITIRALQWPYF